MLTDTQCRTAKPKDKPYKLSDGHRLYLEIKPNGLKAWRYRFAPRPGGVIKASVFAIGDYAVVPTGETAKKRKPGVQDDAVRWRKRGTSAPRRVIWSSRVSTRLISGGLSGSRESRKPRPLSRRLQKNGWP